KEYHTPREVGRRPETGKDKPEPGPGPVPPPPPGPPPLRREFKLIKEGSLEDEFRKRQLIIVGPDGLAIDQQKYQDEWRKKIIELQQKDPVVSKILAGEPVSADEWEELGRRLNAPEMWFDEASLREAFDQPTGSLN